MEKLEFPMSQWSEEDRPREKLLSKGKAYLSNTELISILLGSGKRGESALSLAKRLLAGSENSLKNLGKLDVQALRKIPGIGAAKASVIIAAIELGNRRHNEQLEKSIQIRSSRLAFEALKNEFYDLSHEEFWVLILNRGNEILSKKRISQGGVSGTVADNKIIFKHCLDHLGSSIIVLHNHPSGNMKPSQADISLTKKIKQAAHNLDIQLLDHIIVYNDIFYSFADEGMI